MWELARKDADAPSKAAVIKTLTGVLEDRIIITNYGKQEQPYLYFGFIPGSSILTPWPRLQRMYATIRDKGYEVKA
jgi:hypothetical protein